MSSALFDSGGLFSLRYQSRESESEITVLKFIAQCLQFFGKRALAAEQQSVGHFAERKAKRECWGGKYCGATHGARGFFGEIHIANWIGRNGIDGAAHSFIFQSKAN